MTPPAGIAADLRVEDARWKTLGDLDALCARVLAPAGVRLSATGEVAILFTNDAEMRGLNRTWRKIDKPTDVLSFPSDGPDIPGVLRFLGDLALGYETSTGDAARLGRPLDAHVSHLVLHGFLHLLGYDHIKPADAAVMEKLEADSLADLGWPDPYAIGPYAAQDSE